MHFRTIMHFGTAPTRTAARGRDHGALLPAPARGTGTITPELVRIGG